MTRTDKITALVVAALMGGSVIGIAAMTSDSRDDTPPPTIIDDRIRDGVDPLDAYLEVYPEVLVDEDGAIWAPVEGDGEEWEFDGEDYRQVYPAPEVTEPPVTEPIPAPELTESVTDAFEPWPLNTLYPCDFEDSEYNCYWDAKTRGNGEGTSFVNVDGVTYHFIEDI